ncbi:MAG: CRISPR-associated endonuclease Cas1 [Gammaproteobacteria bacterium]|nr:CRISPR-associated endonuclease Cas1 [Gammaproteobacteria bacterium]
MNILYALEIRLRFIEASEFPFFHQPAVTGWLRHLLGSPPNYERFITIDTPESGCIQYHQGDEYRFTAIALDGGQELLRELRARLLALPESAALRDRGLPLRDNVRFEEARDLFSGRRIQHIALLSAYTDDALGFEAAQWRHVRRCRLRWLSPARLLLDKARRRKGINGEARYCRQSTELPFELLYARLGNTLGGLTGKTPPPLPAGCLAMTHSDIWWVHHAYNKGNGREQPMGGLLGLLEFDCEEFTPEHWRWLVLGQYLGIGQRRVFGWGRYRLESAHGEISLIRTQSGNSLSRRLLTAENLNLAYTVMCDKQKNRAERNKQKKRAEFEDEEFFDDEEAVDEPIDRLSRLQKQLREKTYLFPRLRGQMREKPGRAPRALAVPPFFDRVAQRAAAQVLTPALDALMHASSFGYRQGRSRHGARDRIQRAYAEGCTWVCRADIEAFFDSVEWPYLHTRLRAFFGDELLVKWIMRWISAPVEYQGKIIHRRAGLQQGAPLSPVLANMILDDFDSDMLTAGFNLVRFADDFIVLCKSRAEAESAGQTAAASLGQIALRLNPAKTRICTFEQGFRFLGYTFVNSLALDAGGEKDPVYAPSPHGWQGVETAEALPAAERHEAHSRTNSKNEKSLQKTAGEFKSRQNANGPPLQKIGETGDEGMILFITGEPALLTTRDERLRVERYAEKEMMLDVPWDCLQAVVLFGAHHITTPALRAAFHHRAPVHFASSDGHYQGVAGAPVDEDLWLAQQLWFSRTENALAAARSVVEARLRHQREVLRLRNVDGGLDEALQALSILMKKAMQAQDREQLNGFEGQGGKVYFHALRLLAPLKSFGFDGCNRRPLHDPFNALLSQGYTVLYAHIETLCRVCGLQPGSGFYHQPHGRHAVLASDLMEPFRHLVEQTALSALNKRLLKPEDFYTDAENGCRMNNEARKRYLTLLSEAFERPFQARGENKPYKFYEHMCRQNLHLINWIRGKTDRFEAWRMR